MKIHLISNQLNYTKNLKHGRGLELLIMCLLLSNKGDADNPTDTDWITVKEEIRARTGVAIKKFDKAWKRLKDMGYIKNVGTATRAQWEIWECRNPLPSPMDEIITSTGDVLTNIKETIISQKDYSVEFSELYTLYLSEGIREDGSTYKLKTRVKESQRAYSDYLNTNAMTHSEIKIALEVELNDKQMTGNTHYQPGLYKWIKEKIFEQYRGRTVEPVSMGYGTEII